MESAKDIRSVITKYRQGEIPEKKVRHLIKNIRRQLTKDEFAKSSKKIVSLRKLYKSKMRESMNTLAELEKSDAEFERLMEFQLDNINDSLKLTLRLNEDNRNKNFEEIVKNNAVFKSSISVLNAKQEELKKSLTVSKIKNDEIRDRFSQVFIDKLPELQFLYEALKSVRRYKILLTFFRVLIFVTPFYIKFSYYLFGFCLTLKLEIFSDLLKMNGMQDAFIKPLIYILSLIVLDVLVSSFTRFLMKKLNTMVLHELKFAMSVKRGALFYLNLSRKTFSEVNDLFFK